MRKIDEDQNAKIAVILHEYDTLRDELLDRNDSVFQATITYAAVVIGLIAAWEKLPLTAAIVLTCASSIAFAIILVGIVRDFGRVVLRVREIEADINNRAGERLLEWETLWGAGPFGANPFTKLGRRRKPSS